MHYIDYINNISFKFYKPHMKPIGFKTLSNLLMKVNISLEIENTSIPVDGMDMEKRLRNLCRIRKMSTYAIGAMINKGVSMMPDNSCFVNVGVWHGFTLLAGMVYNNQRKCIGVDNFSQYGSPREQFFQLFNEYKSSNHYFYEVDYLYYFSTIHKDPIGFYMYDGEHDYENQLKGLEAAEPFFQKGCIIMIDDTNGRGPRQATLDFISRRTKEYSLLLDRMTFADRHPTFWNGVLVFQKTS